MNINQEIQELILSKFKSVNQFANAVGIPYTTIKGGLERGVLGMSAQYVIRICQALLIDVESLVNGEIVPITHKAELNSDEFYLVSCYRNTDSYGKEIIFDVAKHESKRYEQQTVKVYKVAKSDDDHSDEIVEISKSELEFLQSQPFTDEEI